MDMRFHSKLYSPRALKEAARQYEGLASIEVSEGPDHHTVSFRAPSPGPENLADEFANCALALMKD